MFHKLGMTQVQDRLTQNSSLTGRLNVNRRKSMDALPT